MAGSDHCYFFLNAVPTLDVLTASNKDVNFVDTQSVHFA